MGRGNDVCGRNALLGVGNRDGCRWPSLSIRITVVMQHVPRIRWTTTNATEYPGRPQSHCGPTGDSSERLAREPTMACSRRLFRSGYRRMKRAHLADAARPARWPQTARPVHPLTEVGLPRALIKTDHADPFRRLAVDITITADAAERRPREGAVQNCWSQAYRRRSATTYLPSITSLSPLPRRRGAHRAWVGVMWPELFRKRRDAMKPAFRPILSLVHSQCLLETLLSRHLRMPPGLGGRRSCRPAQHHHPGGGYHKTRDQPAMPSLGVNASRLRESGQQASTNAAPAPDALRGGRGWAVGGGGLTHRVGTYGKRDVCGATSLPSEHRRCLGMVSEIRVKRRTKQPRLRLCLVVTVYERQTL